MVPGVTRDRKVRSSRRCSMCPAIHITSRSWLRSSSTHEPSDPPLRVVQRFFVFCALSSTLTVRERREHRKKNPTRGAEARWRQAALSLRPRPGGQGGAFHRTASVGCKSLPFSLAWLSPALPRGSIKRGRRYPFSSDGRTGRPSALIVLRSTRKALRRARVEGTDRPPSFPF